MEQLVAVTIPGTLEALYIDLCRQHNAEQDEHNRWTLYCRAWGVLDAIKAEYGDSSAGLVIYHADLAMMDEDGDNKAVGDLP